MSVHGIFKLGWVSIMLQIWHMDFKHFLLPVKVIYVYIYMTLWHFNQQSDRFKLITY